MSSLPYAVGWNCGKLSIQQQASSRISNAKWLEIQSKIASGSVWERMGDLTLLHRVLIDSWYDEMPDIERYTDSFFKTSKGKWIKENVEHIEIRSSICGERNKFLLEIIGILKEDQVIWFTLQWGNENVW